MQLSEVKDLIDSAWLVLGGAAWLLWRTSRLVKRIEEAPSREEFNQLRDSVNEVRRHSGLDLPAAPQVVVVTASPAPRRIRRRDEDGVD